jgi:hypothetical protein
LGTRQSRRKTSVTRPTSERRRSALTRIPEDNSSRYTIIDQLHLKVSAPQFRHTTNVADELLVPEARKTLAEIQREFVSYFGPSNLAGVFRIAPRTADTHKPLITFLTQTASGSRGRSSQVNVVFSGSPWATCRSRIPNADRVRDVDWHYYHSHPQK